MIEPKFKEMPKCCGYCEYIDFSCADPKWGECMITDESNYDIFNTIGEKCPAKEIFDNN